MKRTLILWAAASAIALVALAAGSLYVFARGYLIDRFDASVTRKARLIASTIVIEAADFELGFEDLDMGEFASPDAGGYLQVTFDRDTLYRSPSLGDADLSDADASTDPAATRWIDLPGARRGRGVVYRYTPTSDSDAADPADALTVTLCLARDAAEVQHALTALQLAMLAIGATLAVGLSLVIALAVARAMRPIGRLVRQVEAIDERSLDQRLDLPHLPAELAPIVEQFNALLARLAVAFDRERTFAANMAHELRTPLAGLRMNIEVARSRPRTPADHEQTLDQLLAVTVQMQTLVEGLLQLARLEAGQVTPRRQPVQIDQHVADAWQAAKSNGVAYRAGRERVDLNAPGPVDTDPALLSLALRNVLHNALSYVDDGGQIDIESRSTPDAVTIRVANTGSTIAPADAPKVFDRFWRADRARSNPAAPAPGIRDTSGTPGPADTSGTPDTSGASVTSGAFDTPGTRFGLGLTITKLATTSLGGSTTATSDPAGRFTITMTIPRDRSNGRDEKGPRN